MEMKHAGGRPTSYSEDTVAKAREYIDSCEDTFVVLDRPNVKDGKHIGNEQYRKKIVKLPTIEGLALHLDVTRSTIYEWRGDETKPEFSDIIDKLMSKQANMLANNSLSGDYNPVISKVMLTKHGYTDKVETDITSKGEKILVMPVELIDKNEK